MKPSQVLPFWSLEGWVEACPKLLSSLFSKMFFFRVRLCFLEMASGKSVWIRWRFRASISGNEFDSLLVNAGPSDSGYESEGALVNAHGEVGMDELDGCHDRSSKDARVQAAPQQCVCVYVTVNVDVMGNGADAVQGPRMTAMRDQFKVAEFEDNWVEETKVYF